MIIAGALPENLIPGSESVRAPAKLITVANNTWHTFYPADAKSVIAIALKCLQLGWETRFVPILQWFINKSGMSGRKR